MHGVDLHEDDDDERDEKKLASGFTDLRIEISPRKKHKQMTRLANNSNRIQSSHKPYYMAKIWT